MVIEAKGFETLVTGSQWRESDRSGMMSSHPENFTLGFSIGVMFQNVLFFSFNCLFFLHSKALLNFGFFVFDCDAYLLSRGYYRMIVFNLP
jgi:hypothetical protein